VRNIKNFSSAAYIIRDLICLPTWLSRAGIAQLIVICNK